MNSEIKSLLNDLVFDGNQTRDNISYEVLEITSENRGVDALNEYI